MSLETEIAPHSTRRGHLHRRWLHLLIPLGFLALVVAAWGGVVLTGFWPQYALPSPLAVFDRLANGIRNGTVPLAIALSMKRMAIGYGFSLAVGIVLGMGIARFRLMEQTVGALVGGLQALPSITWLPLALIWFGLNDKAIIFVVIMGSLLAVTQATTDGIKNVPVLYFRASRSLGASGLTMFLRVVLPASLPHIITGMKLGWSFAWRSLMAAELLFVTPGLGHLLDVGREFNDVAQVISVMVVIIVLGLIVDRLIFSRLEGFVRQRWGLGGVRA